MSKKTTSAILVYTPVQQEESPVGKCKVIIYAEGSTEPLKTEFWDWVDGQSLPLSSLDGYPIFYYDNCNQSPGQKADPGFVPISCTVLTNVVPGELKKAKFLCPGGFKIVYGKNRDYYP